nr:hypothetical protein [Tanacetum cinerariifolium]
MVPVGDVSVQEKHKVLDYERTQQLPPTDIAETNNDQYHNEEKSSSASKRRLEKVVKSSQAGTSHSLSSSDSLGLGTRFSTLDFMNSSDSVFRIVSTCSSPILRVFGLHSCNDSLSLPEYDSFHFDIPSSPRPLAKPPDDDSGILTVKVEKSPHLLSYRGLKAFQLPSECPMMIYEGNTPTLDVPFLHFNPL